MTLAETILTTGTRSLPSAVGNIRAVTVKKGQPLVMLRDGKTLPVTDLSEGKQQQILAALIVPKTVTTKSR